MEDNEDLEALLLNYLPKETVEAFKKTATARGYTLEEAFNMAMDMWKTKWLENLASLPDDRPKDRT